MIVASPEGFRAALAARNYPADTPAVPKGVFMVLPENFRVDPESAVDNPYMDTHGPVDPARARAQAEGLASAIEAVGVPLTCFPGREETPEDVFPNNVFGTAPGRFIVGRMRHAGRRREAAREDIRAHFARRELFDLSGLDGVAELTGPLVIDRARKIGFCGMSERVDRAGLVAMHEAFGLRLTFRFRLAAGEYHTNVIMAVLAGRACVLHPGSFADPQAPAMIEEAFPGHTLKIGAEEKNAFVANCIAVTDRDLFMSARAAASLTPLNRAKLRSWGFTLHAVPLDEIEKAGGSLRCMLAEVF